MELRHEAAKLVGLRLYRDSHHGQTAWVIGSGSSLNYISPSFFADKWCMCVNYAGTTLQLPRFYSVSHHHDDADEIARMRPDLTVFTTEVEQVPADQSGGTASTEPNVVKVATTPQRYSAWHPDTDWPSEPDVLTVGPSSIHLTMHLAAYMGAAHIVLVGADCGEFDGDARVSDYRHPDGHLHYSIWTAALEAMATKLRSLGVGVHSLNPWVTPALEGHRYTTAGLAIN